jgi:toxin ParE1/3/4
MKYKVVVSPTAEADLDDIFRFIALDNPKAARKFIAALRTKVEALAQMPARCPAAPEDGLGGLEIRHLIFRSYRILFTIDVHVVRVLRVRHGARLSIWEN